MWPDLPFIESRADVAQALRDVCASAERLDAVLDASAWLLEVLSDLSDQVSGRIVTNRTLGTPRGWRSFICDERLEPELVIAYERGCSFPAFALLLSGPPDRPWATLHRKPLVLERLRRRFQGLLGRSQTRSGRTAFTPLRSTVAAIREQPSPETSGVGMAFEADLVSAEQAYRAVLAAHFADINVEQAGDRPGLSTPLAAHQQRAYERASAILDRYSGVIVADSVGLGKSFVGLRLLADAFELGARAVVVVPATLREQWRTYLGYMTGSDSGERHSTSRAYENLELWVREDSKRVELLSMESLGRSDFAAARFDGADFILVDEAHNFRNPSTRRYRQLSRMSRHARIVLLTATPINNAISDLEHLIDLFAAPGAFRHLGVSDYRQAFNSAEPSTRAIRRIIAACVVRRTRRFLRAHYGPVSVRDPVTGEQIVLRFPRRRDPVTVEYDLAGTYGGVFDELESWLAELSFPTLAEPATSDPASDLLKIILLKRIESSVEAFRASVVQQIAWCETALRALEAGRVITRADYRSGFRGSEDDPGSQLAFFELLLPPPTARGWSLERFRDRLDDDRRVLRKIHRHLASLGNDDRKLATLRTLLEGPLAGKRLIVFTEFKDTARYLHRRLSHVGRIARIDSAQSCLGLERVPRADVISRFAPKSNGLPDPPEIERVDVLIATDVLSEGLNLQDATVAVSYDLPWNPVRLMQRIGRIDRLGSEADVVELYNFVPGAELERILRLMERLHAKVRAIESTLGSEELVLAGANPQHGLDHVRHLAGGAGRLAEIEDELDEHPDPEELAYLDYASQPRAVTNTAPGCPLASIVRYADVESPRAVSYWSLALGPRERALWLSFEPTTGCVSEDQLEAVIGFRQARGGRPAPEARAVLHRARTEFGRFAHNTLSHIEATRLAGDQLHPSLPQCRIAARLAELLRTQEMRLANDSRKRISERLDRLGQRFRAEDERTLRTLADEQPDAIDDAFLRKLDAVLTSIRPERLSPGRVREVATVVLLPE